MGTVLYIIIITVFCYGQRSGMLFVLFWGFVVIIFYFFYFFNCGTNGYTGKNPFFGSWL